MIIPVAEADIISIDKDAFDTVSNHVTILPSGMIEQKYGKIINISSVSGMYGALNMSSNSTAKAGIMEMSKTLTKRSYHPGNKR